VFTNARSGVRATGLFYKKNVQLDVWYETAVVVCSPGKVLSARIPLFCVRNRNENHDDRNEKKGRWLQQGNP